MIFINSDLFLRVSMLSLGTFCININEMTALSHFGEEKNFHSTFFSFCYICQNILKKLSWDWDWSSEFWVPNNKFEWTFLKAFYFLVKGFVLDYGARNCLSHLRCFLLYCLWVGWWGVFLFQGVQAKDPRPFSEIHTFVDTRVFYNIFLFDYVHCQLG